MTNLQIAYVDPSTLAPHPRNARRHSAKQIDQLTVSISEFGFNTPILIDDQNQVLAGHGRLAAAMQLGLTQVPVVTIDHLTEAKSRGFMLADNRLGELSDWDEEILALELEELCEIDQTFEITATGFEMPKIDVLIEERHKPKVEEEDPADREVDPRTVESVAKPGDLWLLGRHRLFVGNALERESYQALLGGERAEMVFVDPPFNVPVQHHVSGLGKAKHPEFLMASGELSDAEFIAFLRTSCMRLIESSIDGSIHFICMDWRGLKALLAAGEVYTELKNICVWVKSQGSMGSMHRSQHELVLVFKSGTAPHRNNVMLGQHGRNRTNVWMMPGMNSFQKGRAEKLAMHPTVKPVALIADAIRDCSKRGGIVLDGFSGSGTTIVAAEETGRQARAIEIDPHYADVSVRRWQVMTGQSAVLENGGVLFDEAAARDQ